MTRGSEAIRDYVFNQISSPALGSKVAARFAITRQAANRHLRSLANRGEIFASGETRNRTYSLVSKRLLASSYDLSGPLEEDEVWRKDIQPLLSFLPKNVLEIWQWSFTEMFNNAIDHSEGTRITVMLDATPVTITILVRDDGIGIFRKLMKRFHLEDERQALLELSKGKLTTDEQRHSGQGIFFTSRMVDDFQILSGETFFSHKSPGDTDWLMESKRVDGTTVIMQTRNGTPRTTRKILARYSVEGSYGFNKTVVPVELARYGTDQLVSRSQAKRVLARVEQFSQVLLDFRGVHQIGQAFGDEIFRVFSLAHPLTVLFPVNANRSILDAYQEAQKTLKKSRRGR